MGNSKVFAATFIASGFVQQMPFAFLGISQAGLPCHTVGQTEYEFVTKIAVQSSAQCSITQNCGGTDRPQACVVPIAHPFKIALQLSFGAIPASVPDSEQTILVS